MTFCGTRAAVSCGRSGLRGFRAAKGALGPSVHLSLAAGVYQRSRAAATRDAVRGRVRGGRSARLAWTHSRLLLPPLLVLPLLPLLLLLLQNVRVHWSRGGRRMSCAGGRRDDTRPRGVSVILVGMIGGVHPRDGEWGTEGAPRGRPR